jgi:ribosomal protein S4
MSGHISKSRELNVDIWGTILNGTKPLRVFRKIYRPYEGYKNAFVLRVDKNRPKDYRKPLSAFSLGKVDKAKFEAFYGLSPRKLRHLIKRERNLRGNLFERLQTTLESQLFIILWRTQLFGSVDKIKPYIRANNVAVNFNTVSNPGNRAFDYDLITLSKFSPVGFIKSIREKRLRLRDEHLLVSYSGFAVVVLPIKGSLFYYFPFDIANIYYTKRYH